MHDHEFEQRGMSNYPFEDKKLNLLRKQKMRKKVNYAAHVSHQKTFTLSHRTSDSCTINTLEGKIDASPPLLRA